MLFSEKSTIYFNFGKTQYELVRANYIAVQIRQKQSLLARPCPVRKFGIQDRKPKKGNAKTKAFTFPLLYFSVNEVCIRLISC